jgi:histidine ammonia-lyase
VDTSPLVNIDGTNLTIPLVKNIAAGGVSVRLDDSVRPLIQAGRELVEATVKAGKQIYGVTTGFGRLKSVMIDPKDAVELQRNLVLSHCTGVGEPLPEDATRASVLLRAHSLARGYSGVRLQVIELLLDMLNRGVTPVIPSKGSVGASGDLAPLAHMALVLIGGGEAYYAGARMPGAEAFKAAGIKPIVLSYKEGLALINGTQVSTALALAGLFGAEDVLAGAIVAGAMSVDALKASDAPFDDRIHQVRGQPGQIAVAGEYRRLIAGSEIRASHLDCSRVQDPYSYRCQPQVMGACLDLIRHGAGILRVEANAVTDNPLLFVEQGEVLSGGNFHAEPVAFAADTLALALAEIGNMSERRMAVLVDPKMSGLPAFLVENSGLNSGFMIAQVTAAALVSENKALAVPCSTDSIPTSANQEDHVSMATYAARRLGAMVDNAAAIVGIELLAAAQGIDFHRPARSSATLEQVHADIRSEVARYAADRYLAPDIEAARGWIKSGRFAHLVGPILPSRA